MKMSPLFKLYASHWDHSIYFSVWYSVIPSAVIWALEVYNKPIRCTNRKRFAEVLFFFGQSMTFSDRHYLYSFHVVNKCRRRLMLTCFRYYVIYPQWGSCAAGSGRHENMLSHQNAMAKHRSRKILLLKRTYSRHPVDKAIRK